MNRRLPLAPVQLLLLASHAALFFMAAQRGEVSDAGMSAGSGGELPAKAGTRGRSVAPREEAERFTRRLRELEQSPLPYAEFEAARRELFREWLRHDLRSALDQLYSPLREARQEKLAESLEDEIHEAIARQAREVWSWIEAREYGSLTPGLSKIWLEAVLRDNQRELALELLPGVPDFAVWDFVKGICKQATPVELAKIREFLASPRTEAAGDRDSMVSGYVERLVQLPGAEQEKLLAMGDDPGFRTAFAKSWTERELSHLPVSSAVSGVAALPPDLRETALIVLAMTPPRGGPVAAAALLQEMDSRDLLTGLSQERLDDLLFWSVSVRVADNDLPLAEAMAPYFQIARPELRRTALEKLGEAFKALSRDPQEIIESLPQLPAGPDRDALVASAAKEYSYDKEAQHALLDAIGDAELRAKTEREIEGEE